MKKRKTKHVRLAILALSMLLSLCLSGCGGGKSTVPDSYIDAEIQNFLTRKYSGPDYTPDSFRFTVSHSPDSSMHTDGVTVSIMFQYPYGTAAFSANGTYQYIKNNDIWEGSLHFDWGGRSYTLDEKALCMTFDTYGKKIQVNGVDLKAGTISCDYTMDGASGSGVFALKKAYYDNYEFVIEAAGTTYAFEIVSEKGIRWLY